MSTSKAIKVETESLIDYITTPPAPNELLNIRAIPGGHRYRFSGRVLPPWFKTLSRKLGSAMIDDDASQRKPGRTVSLVKAKYADRTFQN